MLERTHSIFASHGTQPVPTYLNRRIDSATARTEPAAGDADFGTKSMNMDVRDACHIPNSDDGRQGRL